LIPIPDSHPAATLLCKTPRTTIKNPKGTPTCTYSTPCPPAPLLPLHFLSLLLSLHSFLPIFALLQELSRMSLSAIILAAGKATRMKSDRVKVLHEICGRPMLSYVLDACREVGVTKLFLVIGHDRQRVIDTYTHD